MKVQSLIATLAISAFAATAFAQKGEIFGNYTYMQFNPTITGLNSRALNGGGGGAQWNIKPSFAIKGEFQGYMSTETTVNVTSPIPVNNGLIPVGTYKSNATMFTYLFGPVIQLPGKRVRPFGEVLFGGMQTELYSQLNSAVIANGGKLDASKTQHPFTMAVGGGLDVNINKHVAVRLAEVDWVLTRYTNPWTSTNNQNSFRYLAGVVIKFGGERVAPPPPPAPPATKTCPGGITVPASQECPKRSISLALSADKSDVCVGTAVNVSPGANLPSEAALQWAVNGSPATQGRTFQFQTASLAPGTYRIAAKATAEGFDDASGETSVTVRGYEPPTGTVTVTPSEIWAGEKAGVNSSFQPGRCGETLQPASFQVSEGSILGNTFDSSSVAFDPSNNSEQQKTVVITATASDGKSQAVAKASLVVKKKGATLARRLPDVVFPAGSSRVNNCGKRVLLEELKALTANDPTGTVIFVGHKTDKEAKSAGLDEKRALNAAAVISAGQGICTNFSAGRIQVSATGATQGGVEPQPYFCGASAGSEQAGQRVAESDDQAKYRRVEVWFVPTGGVFPSSVSSYKSAGDLSVAALGCPK